MRKQEIHGRTPRHQRSFPPTSCRPACLFSVVWGLPSAAMCVPRHVSQTWKFSTMPAAVYSDDFARQGPSNRLGQQDCEASHTVCFARCVLKQQTLDISGANIKVSDLCAGLSGRPQSAIALDEHGQRRHIGAAALLSQAPLLTCVRCQHVLPCITAVSPYWDSTLL